jgi:hypothetical protein
MRSESGQTAKYSNGADIFPVSPDKSGSTQRTFCNQPHSYQIEASIRQQDFARQVIGSDEHRDCLGDVLRVGGSAHRCAFPPNLLRFRPVGGHTRVHQAGSNGIHSDIRRERQSYDVDFVQFLPNSWRRRSEVRMRDEAADPGVVDQNIEPPPMGNGLPHKPNPVDIPREVGLDVGCRPKLGGQCAPSLGRTSRVQNDRESITG